MQQQRIYMYGKMKRWICCYDYYGGVY